MDGRAMFAVQVLVYAVPPLVVATWRSSTRLVLLYTHIAVVHVVGGFLGAVFSFPLTDGISLSAGSVAYGGLMMTAIVLVIVERDVRVIRNVVWIVVATNVVKFGVYATTSAALGSPVFPNPYDTAPAVFRTSVGVVVLGGALIIAELLLLIAAYERLSRSPVTRNAPVVYVAFFVAVLCLDGVLFPVLYSPFADDLGAIIATQVQAKFVLAVAYSVPFGVFLFAFRSQLAAYGAMPVRLVELFLRSKDDLVDEIERQRVALDAWQERAAALVADSSDIVAIVDTDMKVLFANPALESLTGLTTEGMDRLAILELAHPDDVERGFGSFDRLLSRPGESVAYRIRIRRADGRWRHLDVVLNNQLDNPAIGGIVVSASDSTEAEHDKRLLETHSEILSMIATGKPISRCLDAIGRLVEERLPDSRASFATSGGPEWQPRADGSEGEPAGLTSLSGPLRVAAETLAPVSGSSDDGSTIHAFPIIAPGEEQLLGVLGVHLDGSTGIDPSEQRAIDLAVSLSRIAIERQADIDRLRHQALHDALTGLPNRVLLHDRLTHALERDGRTHATVGLLFLDLDNFKQVNDTLGHNVGDKLLCDVSQRVQEHLRPGDSVARLGGDEFVVLAEDLTDETEALIVAARILGALRKPFTVEGTERVVTASIGVAVSSDASSQPDILLSQADAAMYRAKDGGRDRAEVFDPELQHLAETRFATALALRHAVARGELELHYQPQVRIATGEVEAVEALLRWNRPGHGLVGPAGFIDLAEETGLIVPIGAWVVEEACRQAARWVESGHRLRVGLNLSARQLTDADVVGTVERALYANDLDPDVLTLEITETALMSETGQAHETLADLMRLGVRISIDDFGTGYSSLLYLKRLPVDEMKIDIDFVGGLGRSDEDDAIVQGCIQLADAFGLTTVAEGVETESQLEILSHLGCTTGQGYFIARPTAVADLDRWLVARHSDVR